MPVLQIISTAMGLCAGTTANAEASKPPAVARGSLIVAIAFGTLIGTNAACAPPKTLRLATANTTHGTADQVPRVVIAHNPSESTAGQIHELRLRSGLTWEMIAKLFDVDRRSVHLWASGHRLNSLNAQRLGRILNAIRQIDRGSRTLTRDALLSISRSGEPRLKLLATERYQEFLADLSVTTQAPAGVSPSPSTPTLAITDLDPITRISSTAQSPRVRRARLISSRRINSRAT